MCPAQIFTKTIQFLRSGYEHFLQCNYMGYLIHVSVNFGNNYKIKLYFTG